MRKQKAKQKVPAPPPAVVVPASPRVEAVAIGLLLLLQFAFWWKAALLRGFYLVSDACFFFEPMKSFLHERLRAGHLALWSPYILSGYPVGAEGQIAAFYPPSLLFSWLLDGGGAVNWLLISHLMLAAVGMYLLARRLGTSPFGAWLGGAVFSFCGYFFAHLQHVSLVCAGAWLPLLVLFVDRSWARRSLTDAACAALAWAATALAGHPQTLFYSSLAVLFWVLWRTAQERRVSRRWPGGRAAALLALTYGLGAGVAAVQLLLTRDLAALAPHGEAGTLGYVTSFSLLGKHLFGLLSPNFQGSPAFADYHGERYFWEYVLYVGLLPLALAVVGGATRRGWTLAGFALGALVLAMAEGNPLYELLVYVPGFATFRGHARFIYLFTFGAALLAGMGWDFVAGQRWWRDRRLLAAVASVAALLTLGDLWYFARALRALTSAELYHRPHGLVQGLQADQEWWRTEIRGPIVADAEWTPAGGWARNPDGWADARYALGADIPQSFGLRTIEGYATFVDAQHAQFMGVAQSALAGPEPDVRVHSLLGVRYLLLPPGTSLPLPRQEVPGFAVFRNAGAFPRAFGVGEVTSGSSRADGRAKALSLWREDRLGQAAAVHGSLGSFRPRGAARVTITDIAEMRPEQVRIRARADRDALLVFNERWDPGWQAAVDGKAAPLVEVDGFLMGAPLPAGEHVVEFCYRPRGLTVGLPITLISLAACLLLIVIPAVRGRKKPA